MNITAGERFAFFFSSLDRRALKHDAVQCARRQAQSTAAARQVSDAAVLHRGGDRAGGKTKRGTTCQTIDGCGLAEVCSERRVLQRCLWSGARCATSTSAPCPTSRWIGAEEELTAQQLMSLALDVLMRSLPTRSQRTEPTKCIYRDAILGFLFSFFQMDFCVPRVCRRLLLWWLLQNPQLALRNLPHA